MFCGKAPSYSPSLSYSPCPVSCDMRHVVTLTLDVWGLKSVTRCSSWAGHSGCVCLHGMTMQVSEWQQQDTVICCSLMDLQGWCDGDCPWPWHSVHSSGWTVHSRTRSWDRTVKLWTCQHYTRNYFGRNSHKDSRFEVTLPKKKGFIEQMFNILQILKSF